MSWRKSPSERKAAQDAWDFRFYGTARTAVVRQLLPTSEIVMHTKPDQGIIAWTVDGRHTITWTNDGDPEFTVTDAKGSSFSANDLYDIVEWIKKPK